MKRQSGPRISNRQKNWSGKAKAPAARETDRRRQTRLARLRHVPKGPRRESGNRAHGQSRGDAKAERFQLFAEVKDTGIVGIVKSQSSGDLVYSSRLNADGTFGCCTQNLRPCGGLRGALCKHLLVLIVGLAKAGQLDPATVNLWVDLSTNNKPAIDEEAMSATFLRYKGAESGELDWRPTETIPEDFYAM